MRRAFALIASSGIAACAVVACVGDDPDANAPPATSPESGTPDSGTDGGGSTDSQTPTDTGADGGEVKRLVFVTAAQYPADFAMGNDPWAAADAICADEATGSGLPGTFVAWLSYKNAGGTSFNAAGRITDAPYYLPANAAEGGAPVLVVESKMELLTTGPRVPIERRPNGTLTGTDSNLFAGVWTGTGATGNASGADCQAWSVTNPDGSSPSATNGNAVKYSAPAAKDWTDFAGRLCTMASRLYCFQK